MFRESDAETESVTLSMSWSVRAEPPQHIIHVCGPAFSGACIPVDVGAMRYAQCERCGARIDYTSLARWLRRVASR